MSLFALKLLNQPLAPVGIILQECAHRFPVPLYDNEGKKTEKFILSVSPDQLKAVLTLTGDAITQAVSIINQAGKLEN